MPPISSEYEYTLVLDLDETLIHYHDEGYYLIRPGVLAFLEETAKYYEIILFTAACKYLLLLYFHIVKDYADVIVDQIDPDRHIKHRLYRQHCSPEDDIHVKDIFKIGRGLEKIIIVDNLAESF
jgi:CTD small phosphatase-like protein 2